MAKVNWHGEKLKREIQAKCLKNMSTACLFLEKEIKESLSGPSPSAPGEPPGVITGELRRSITHEIEKKPTGVIGRVGSNKEYAIHLELGTSKMAARPFLRPKLEENKKNIAKTLTSEK